MSPQQLLHGASLDAAIGMYPVIHRLRSTVVTPVVAAALGDPHVVAPKSVLLYGPPRCGAAFIAERLSAEVEDLSGRRVVTLGRLDSSSTPDTVAEVMRDAATAGELVVATCHEPWALGEGIVASFDRLCFVHPPDWEARRFRLWESPLGRAVDAEALDEFVVATEGWCGADIAEGFADDAGAAHPPFGVLGPITDAWFDTARAWAAQSERSLGVDDLMSYLGRVRRR